MDLLENILWLTAGLCGVRFQDDLDDGLKGDLWEVVHNREEWWVAGKALECRQQLENYWRNGCVGALWMFLCERRQQPVNRRCSQTHVALGDWG